MGALQINCYCNESQMTSIVNAVSSHLYNSDSSNISDFDDTIGGVRVCIEFDSYPDTVFVKTAEIFNADWDVLYEDTAVLTSRLKDIVSDYNRNSNEAYSQALEIRKDENN